MKEEIASKARTGLLIILDGFGINPSAAHNAVAQAKMPVYQTLLARFPHTQIEASEKNVGLPQGFMGNSEVGHLNIGAGRVVFQDFSLISRAIDEGSFFKNPELLNLFSQLSSGPKARTLHLMGLLSDGGVHSHISHLMALVDLAQKQNVSSIQIHCFLDGRDTSPKSGTEFLKQLQSFLKARKTGVIASVMGRFYAMDRDSRWDRTQKAYEALVNPAAVQRFQDPVHYVESCYLRNETDEFIAPATADNYEGLKDGDGVVFYNFRADRARQLVRALTQSAFDGFARSRTPQLVGFVCMTPYEESLKLPVAFEKAKVPMTLGEVICARGWKQLRIAETEKYAHVTYFFNGEKRVLVPSPREVKTYDLKPEMSAEKVTSELLKELQTGNYEFAVVNFANPDMVGHTGNLEAAKKALEVIDQCLGKILAWVEQSGAFAIITADHGNCELMQDSEGQPLTSHTLLPVPFIFVDPKHPAAKLAASGKLSDIAATFLKIWGLTPPREMTGQSLVLSL